MFEHEVEKRDAVMEEVVRGGIVLQGVDVEFESSVGHTAAASPPPTAKQCSLSFWALTTKPKASFRGV